MRLPGSPEQEGKRGHHPEHDEGRHPSESGVHPGEALIIQGHQLDELEDPENQKEEQYHQGEQDRPESPYVLDIGKTELHEHRRCSLGGVIGRAS